MGKYTFILKLIFIFNCHVPGYGQKPILVMNDYSLRGGWVEIQCMTNIIETRTALMAIQYKNQTKYKDMVSVTEDKTDSEVKEFKDKIKKMPFNGRDVKVNYTELECSDAHKLQCYTIVKPNYDRPSSKQKNINVIDNTGDITLKVQEAARACSGTDEQCRRCKQLSYIEGYEQIGYINGYAQIGKSFTVECTKLMPFPYKLPNVNTFKWYLQATANQKIDESEINDGTTGTSPTLSNSSVQRTEPTAYENCKRVQEKTSSLTYTPTEKDTELINVKCRVDLRAGSLTDSKQKQIRLCLLMKWTVWTPWTQCTENCTRSQSRECLASKCTEKSVNLEKCTGDLCNKEIITKKENFPIDPLPIIIAAATGFLIAIATGCYLIKFRSSEKTKGPHQTKIGANTLENVTSNLDTHSKVSSRIEMNMLNKPPETITKSKSLITDMNKDDKEEMTKQEDDRSRSDLLSTASARTNNVSRSKQERKSRKKDSNDQMKKKKVKDKEDHSHGREDTYELTDDSQYLSKKEKQSRSKSTKRTK